MKIENKTYFIAIHYNQSQMYLEMLYIKEKMCFFSKITKFDFFFHFNFYYCYLMA